MKKTSKVALGGLMAALSFVLMLLSGVVPFFSYTIPAFCGVLIVIMVLEAGSKWALGVYAAVSLLSLLLVGDKESAVLYTLCFGFYPVLKQKLEQLKSRLLEWILKILLFNILAVSTFLITVNIFNIPLDASGDFGKYAAEVMLVLGNVFFILYDIALSKMIVLYIHVWQKRFRRLFK